MNDEQDQIRHFMTKAGQDTPACPTVPSADVRALRVRTIGEELIELANASNVRIVLSNTGDKPVLDVEAISTLPETVDLVEVYDALLDIQVFTVGSANAYGLKLAPGWDEVHRSNMAKFAPGGYRRDDGKWMKPPSWEPPKLAAIVQAQIDAAAAQPGLI
jgi:predicted HAD superfamily Cof-like phosphohydrolase